MTQANASDSIAGKTRSSSTRDLRILVPIDATEESRWGIRYAIWRHTNGRRVEVILLHVGEPITQWEVLRFRTQREISEFQTERGQALIDEAAHALLDRDIPIRGFFRQGDLVFSILDTAEEFDCHEIAVPKPASGLRALFHRGSVKALLRRQRGIPVVTVDKNGTRDPV